MAPASNVIPLPGCGAYFAADPRFDHILDEVCVFYRVRKNEIRSARKEAGLVRPRQVVMYLCRKHTSRSMPEIGKFLGGKDHTTVLHGARKIKHLLLTDERLRDEIEVLELRIKARSFKASQEILSVALRDASAGDTPCNSAQTPAI